MSLELAELAARLPFAASLATVGSGGAPRLARRRTALNEALHELRRPLQALALAMPPEVESRPAVDSSLRLAAAALERLDLEINGGRRRMRLEEVDLRSLTAAAVQRWKAWAEAGGGRLTLRWRAGEAEVRGDAVDLAQALDNMIINGLEHGGPDVVVEVSAGGGELRVLVRDSGAFRAGSGSARRVPGRGRLTGRLRHGHGLRVVRRVAAAHGGSFELRAGGRGTEAVLRVPAAARGRGSGRAFRGSDR
jgi:signal transduction histidine kinase